MRSKFFRVNVAVVMEIFRYYHMLILAEIGRNGADKENMVIVFPFSLGKC
jgi:hypothetical protein